MLKRMMLIRDSGLLFSFNKKTIQSFNFNVKIIFFVLLKKKLVQYYKKKLVGFWFPATRLFDVFFYGVTFWTNSTGYTNNTKKYFYYLATRFNRQSEKKQIFISGKLPKVTDDFVCGPVLSFSFAREKTIYESVFDQLVLKKKNVCLQQKKLSLNLSFFKELNKNNDQKISRKIIKKKDVDNAVQKSVSKFSKKRQLYGSKNVANKSHTKYGSKSPIKFSSKVKSRGIVKPKPRSKLVSKAKLNSKLDIKFLKVLVRNAIRYSRKPSTYFFKYTLKRLGLLAKKRESGRKVFLGAAGTVKKIQNKLSSQSVKKIVANFFLLDNKNKKRLALLKRTRVYLHAKSLGKNLSKKVRFSVLKKARLWVRSGDMNRKMKLFSKFTAFKWLTHHRFLLNKKNVFFKANYLRPWVIIRKKTIDTRFGVYKYWIRRSIFLISCLKKKNLMFRKNFMAPGSAMQPRFGKLSLMTKKNLGSHVFYLNFLQCLRKIRRKFVRAVGKKFSFFFEGVSFRKFKPRMYFGLNKSVNWDSSDYQIRLQTYDIATQKFLSKIDLIWKVEKFIRLPALTDRELARGKEQRFFTSLNDVFDLFFFTDFFIVASLHGGSSKKLTNFFFLFRANKYLIFFFQKLCLSAFKKVVFNFPFLLNFSGFFKWYNYSPTMKVKLKINRVWGKKKLNKYFLKAYKLYFFGVKVFIPRRFRYNPFIKKRQGRPFFTYLKHRFKLTFFLVTAMIKLQRLYSFIDIWFNRRVALKLPSLITLAMSSSFTLLRTFFFFLLKRYYLHFCRKGFKRHGWSRRFFNPGVWKRVLYTRRLSRRRRFVFKRRNGKKYVAILYATLWRWWFTRTPTTNKLFLRRRRPILRFSKMTRQKKSRIPPFCTIPVLRRKGKLYQIYSRRITKQWFIYNKSLSQLVSSRFYWQNRVLANFIMEKYVFFFNKKTNVLQVCFLRWSLTLNKLIYYRVPNYKLQLKTKLLKAQRSFKSPVKFFKKIGYLVRTCRILKKTTFCNSNFNKKIFLCVSKISKNAKFKKFWLNQLGYNQLKLVGVFNKFFKFILFKFCKRKKSFSFLRAKNEKLLKRLHKVLKLSTLSFNVKQAVVSKIGSVQSAAWGSHPYSKLVAILVLKFLTVKWVNVGNFLAGKVGKFNIKSMLRCQYSVGLLKTKYLSEKKRLFFGPLVHSYDSVMHTRLFYNFSLEKKIYMRWFGFFEFLAKTYFAFYFTLFYKYYLSLLLKNIKVLLFFHVYSFDLNKIFLLLNHITVQEFLKDLPCVLNTVMMFYKHDFIAEAGVMPKVLLNSYAKNHLFIKPFKYLRI
jgi:hypothetical protein